MSDSLTIFGTTYSDVAGFKAAVDSSTILTYIRPQGTLAISSNGTSIDVAQYSAVDVAVSGGGSTPVLLDKTNITPTESSQTITYDTGYDGLNSVLINAIPSNYVMTSDATASAADIISSKTAYASGSKLTGTLLISTYYTGTSTPSAALGTNGDIYLLTSS